MCDCLEGEDDDRAAQPAIPLGILMERSREIEARKIGDRVPDELWAVFFGLRSGSIPWMHHQRMLVSRETALAFLSASVTSRRRYGRGSDLCCTEESLNV